MPKVRTCQYVEHGKVCGRDCGKGYKWCDEHRKVVRFKQDIAAYNKIRAREGKSPYIPSGRHQTFRQRHAAYVGMITSYNLNEDGKYSSDFSGRAVDVDEGTFFRNGSKKKFTSND